jgi:metallo-beta-lactamase class B
MKRLIPLLLALALAPPGFAQKDPVSREWNEPVPPFRIAPNLYYVGAKDITSYLITTRKGHIVLDGGFEETAPMIRANIERLGFRVKDVRILIGSHPHYDHAGGLAELKRVTGAKFIASKLDAPAYARGGLDDPMFGDRFPFPPVMPDGLVVDGGKVKLGNVTLTARITAGHTRGCTTWLMGDTVFVCSPTAPGYQLVENRKYPDVIDDYRRQFALLRSLRPKIFLASHGNFFNLEEKRKTGASFVDAEGYRAFVAAQEKRFEDEVAKQQAAKR